jgi:hypothetical protein
MHRPYKAEKAKLLTFLPTLGRRTSPTKEVGICLGTEKDYARRLKTFSPEHEAKLLTPRPALLLAMLHSGFKTRLPYLADLLNS